MQAFVVRIADQIASTPREGRFEYVPDGATVHTLASGQYGYALDAAATVEMIARASVAEQREIVLPVMVIAPRVTLADLEQLLPLDLLSEGETSFEGSTPGRLQNIHVASARFHGVVIPPHSTFSFLDNLGLVTTANGYGESWIIYGDRTVLGPGGGVCQVSTTCFRAAFLAGLPIVERWPHTFRVSWYEPPLGLDAAVFSPTTDMKFANDTDTPIIIETEVDEDAAKLYFRFYGKSTGRTVTLEGPETSNPTKPGDPVFDVDSSLAPGQRIRLEWAHDGIDASVHRTIQQDGQLIVKELLFSRYEPWPDRFRIAPSDQPQAVEENPPER